MKKYTASPESEMQIPNNQTYGGSKMNDLDRKILSENYVRPDQSEYVKSKIKENGMYTIIDKITVRLDDAE
jgi:predicted ATP-dependent Lon-type protease